MNNTTPAAINHSGRWEETFLAALAETGNVRAASEAAGISHTRAYMERKRNPDFALTWQAVKATTKCIRRSANPWRTEFLKALARSGRVCEALRAAQVSRTNAYATRNRDPAFASAWTRVLADFLIHQSSQRHYPNSYCSTEGQERTYSVQYQQANLLDTNNPHSIERLGHLAQEVEPNAEKGARGPPSNHHNE